MSNFEGNKLYKGRLSTYTGLPISQRTHLYGEGNVLYWMQQNYMNSDIVILQINGKI